MWPRTSLTETGFQAISGCPMALEEVVVVATGAEKVDPGLEIVIAGAAPGPRPETGRDVIAAGVGRPTAGIAGVETSAATHEMSTIAMSRAAGAAAGESEALRPSRRPMSRCGTIRTQTVSGRRFTITVAATATVTVGPMRPPSSSCASVATSLRTHRSARTTRIQMRST